MKKALLTVSMIAIALNFSPLMAKETLKEIEEKTPLEIITTPNTYIARVIFTASDEIAYEIKSIPEKNPPINKKTAVVSLYYEKNYKGNDKKGDLGIFNKQNKFIKINKEEYPEAFAELEKRFNIAPKTTGAKKSISKMVTKLTL